MKKPKTEIMVKRSRAAEILGGLCSRTMRRYEIQGQLTPVKQNSRVTLYRLSEVEKIQRGEIAMPSPVTLHTAPARAASGQFVGAA